MKKLFTLVSLFFTVTFSSLANVFVTEQMSATKGAQVKSSVQADTYYIISGIDQNNVEYYLYDNGGQVKGCTPLPETSTHIWTLKASDNKWVVVNAVTGMNMNLGGSNGSAIKTSSEEQANAIHFGSDGYLTILNANGQAIDMTANGANPTTWSGTTTPNGSRRLKMYLAEDIVTTEVKSLSLIPAPKMATVGEGEYVLGEGFTIAMSEFADGERAGVLADVARFISTMNNATGLGCKAANADADITITENTTLAAEGYVLDITQEGVTIEASTADGVFYAMQSLMRLLPANVILGKQGEEGTT